jgi:LAO/AO transport system ATPase
MGRFAMPATNLDQLVSDAAQREGPRAIRAAARLMSIMADQPHRVAELLAGSSSWPEPRMVLGITGSPGCGKSTLTDHLVAEYRARHPDKRVGVVAVDPSSPFTGGAVLGDRVRMMRHATDPNVFIRSLASRGHLGGLSLGAKGVVRVMGLIGCDVVFIETVGVGQSEVEIARNADRVVVVLAPGQGDTIQLLKAGLMEAGDLFVVNKADREGSAHLYSQLLAVLQLGKSVEVAQTHALGHSEGASCGLPAVTVSAQSSAPAPVSAQPPAPAAADALEDDDELVDLGAAKGKSKATAAADTSGDTPVFLVCAADHVGLDQLVDYLEQAASVQGQAWKAARQDQIEEEVRDAVFEQVRQRVAQVMGVNGKAGSRIASILRGELTVQRLSYDLMTEALSQDGVE